MYVGRSSTETKTEAAEVKLLVSVAGFALLETEIQKWGTNCVSKVWTRKYKKRKMFWCEQMFVKFNCFFQVAIFSETLGYRMDVSGVQSATGTRDFSHFLQRSNWSPPPPNQCVLRVVVLKVKWPWLEADHLLTASAEV